MIIALPGDRHLLAWLPRGERPDPPAGQSERPPPASPTPTTQPGDDD
jgi:hypothetical protein